jgi:periplasmic protein CpxP/Spy
MSTMQKSLIAAAVALGLGAVAAGAVAPGAFAQAGAPAAAAVREERPSRIEGRLAFLKTELKITDAQSGAWNTLADVMRKQDKDMREARRQARETRQKEASALEKLEQSQRHAALRAAATQEFVAAFRPLYQTLSAEQKKTADDLFARGGGMRGRHRHH